MEYTLIFSELIYEQLEKLNNKTKKLLSKRLLLLKQNPFRNKRIYFGKYFLFRIRFEDDKQGKRLIYLVDKPYVKLLFILDRKNNYSDLNLYLNKSGQGLLK